MKNIASIVLLFNLLTVSILAQTQPRVGVPVQSNPQNNAQMPAFAPGFSTPNADNRQAATTPVTPAQVPNSTAVSPSDNGSLGQTHQSSSSLLKMFHDGGWPMYPIALCSFVLLIFVFERGIFLRSSRVIPKPFVRRLIEQLEQQQIERDEAYELCVQNPSPIAQIFAATLKKYGRPSVEVEQAAMDSGERVANYLRRNIRIINAISNVCPLLGLLGTVLGMIQSFKMITSDNAMGHPELLAGGIAQALLTTAAGLIVAIPAYVAYVYFLGRTDRLVMELDEYSQQVVDAISAEGLHENDSSKSRTRTRRNAA